MIDSVNLPRAKTLLYFINIQVESSLLMYHMLHCSRSGGGGGAAVSSAWGTNL